MSCIVCSCKSNGEGKAPNKYHSPQFRSLNAQQQQHSSPQSAVSSKMQIIHHHHHHHHHHHQYHHHIHHHHHHPPPHTAGLAAGKLQLLIGLYLHTYNPRPAIAMSTMFTMKAEYGNSENPLQSHCTACISTHDHESWKEILILPTTICNLIQVLTDPGRPPCPICRERKKERKKAMPGSHWPIHLYVQAQHLILLAHPIPPRQAPWVAPWPVP
ncbi:hypothetical protein DFP73DRAFT_196458 [Morchella snyderi]|nr:hypothetical protein DFP73DRAFT_196458 [Morchella snyderi]